MIDHLKVAQRYVRYRQRSQGAVQLHSPFVFSLYTETIRTNRHYYAFDELRALRQDLLRDERIVRVTDYGAGSKMVKGNERKVKQIARTALQTEKVGRLLFYLVDRFQPQTMLELGTSLGLTTLYQYLPSYQARFLTFEGCPETAGIAQENFSQLAANLEVVIGNLDETLASSVERLDRIDYALFDANHRYEPTLRYFEQCLGKAHTGSLFIFDDIYYSEEMQRAWEAIKAHEAVRLTVDLFEVGLVFFRDQQPKQHFTLKF